MLKWVVFLGSIRRFADMRSRIRDSIHLCCKIAQTPLYACLSCSVGPPTPFVNSVLTLRKVSKSIVVKRRPTDCPGNPPPSVTQGTALVEYPYLAHPLDPGSCNCSRSIPQPFLGRFHCQANVSCFSGLCVAIRQRPKPKSHIKCKKQHPASQPARRCC